MGVFQFPLSGAIASAEGYGVPGAIPTRANNPGDLKLGDIGFGTTPNGITIFGSPQDGADALDRQVGKMVNGGSSVYSPNDTLAQAASKYAPGAQSTNWLQNVASKLGVDPNTKLGQLAGIAGGAITGGLTMGLYSDDGTAGGQTGLASNYVRLVCGIVGLILIAAGVFYFKPVRDTVVEVSKKSGEVAAAAA